MLTQEQLTKMSSRDRTRAVLSDKDLWPNWPFMPMTKKLLDHPFNKQLAVVVDHPNHLIFYKDANLFLDPITWKDPRNMTIDEIIEDGWEVN